MPVTCTEKFESRRASTGSYASTELRYTIRGTNEQTEAHQALLDASPTSYDPWGSGLLFYPRDTVSVEPVGDQLWEGVVRYSSVYQTNDSCFSFDTSGGSQHITQSRSTVGRYAPPGKTAPDCKGAIGVTRDSVEGVDIPVPMYRFAERHYLPDATVTAAYKGLLYLLTGRVNDASFKGFAAGECLFLGAYGDKRGQGDWEINFNFAGSPNVTGLVVGDIMGISKGGWEYLWVRYADVEDTVAQALVKRPTAAYVEQVYQSGPFALLGIGV